MDTTKDTTLVYLHIGLCPRESPGPTCYIGLCLTENNAYKPWVQLQSTYYWFICICHTGHIYSIPTILSNVISQ